MKQALKTLREKSFSQHERGHLEGAELGYLEVLRRSPDDLDIIHALGLLRVQSGRYASAVGLLETAAAARATAGAHADLGDALLGLSRFEDALRRYERALALEPGLPTAWLNRGHALRALGRREEAAASYERALEAAPQFDAASVARAGVLQEHTVWLLGAGRYAEALAGADRLIASGGESAEAWTLRGLSQAGLGRRADAMESYDRALRRQPDYVPAYVNRGIVLRGWRRPEEALANYEAALRLGADGFEALCNRAAVLIDLNRFADALCDADRALALRPDHEEVHLHRAAALLGLDRFETALGAYDQVIAVRPNSAEAHAGRAAALQYLQRHQEALESSERAIALAPTLADGYANRGSALRDLGRIDAAIENFESAQRLRPDDATHNCSLGGLYLLMGRFERGFELYEWRSQLPQASQFHRYPQPRWNGEDLRGRTLFVYLDQGLGDTIQFCRYAALAERRGARVVMAVQGTLRALLAGVSSTLEILHERQAPPAFDFHCPLASLPLAFKTTLDTIPAAVPYLAAQPERVAHWRRRIGAGGYKIGICWQGNQIKSGAGRSFPLAELRRIADLQDVRLISLQRGEGIEQLADLPQVEVLGEEFDAGPDAFLDAAAVMRCVDLVITCDTSIAHVAGALGCPAWVVLKRIPDWRWLLGRDDSPWYPTLRLFRQKSAGVWDDVFAAVHEELRSRLGRRG